MDKCEFVVGMLVQMGAVNERECSALMRRLVWSQEWMKNFACSSLVFSIFFFHIQNPFESKSFLYD